VLPLNFRKPIFRWVFLSWAVRQGSPSAPPPRAQPRPSCAQPRPPARSAPPLTTPARHVMERRGGAALTFSRRRSPTLRLQPGKLKLGGSAVRGGHCVGPALARGGPSSRSEAPSGAGVSVDISGDDSLRAFALPSSPPRGPRFPSGFLLAWEPRGSDPGEEGFRVRRFLNRRPSKIELTAVTIELIV
jgi:hypothetical protein